MKIFQIDVRVYATAYIRANSEEEALEQARALKDMTLEVEDSGVGDVEISGAPYDDLDLPDISLSPAMTIWGVEEEALIEEVE